MLEGMKEIIEKNLPAQTADYLKTFVEAAAADKRELKEAKENIDKLNTLIAQLNREKRELSVQLGAYKDIEDREAKLIQGEKALEKDRNRLTIDIMNIKLDEAEKRAVLAKGYVETVFKSPVFRSFVNTNTNYQPQYENGQTHHVPVSKTVNAESRED